MGQPKMDREGSKLMNANPSVDEAEFPLELGAFLNFAWDRANRSLDEAKRLREHGSYGPALVWAVRAGEIFTREFLLTPLFLDEKHDVPDALRRARKVFGSGNWIKAYALEISVELADWAIGYVAQLFEQMVLRMIVSRKHPSSDVFMKVAAAIRRALKPDTSSETMQSEESM
jgi:HEPN domain-containing protein